MSAKRRDVMLKSSTTHPQYSVVTRSEVVPNYEQASMLDRLWMHIFAQAQSPTERKRLEKIYTQLRK